MRTHPEVVGWGWVQHSPLHIILVAAAGAGAHCCVCCLGHMARLVLPVVRDPAHGNGAGRSVLVGSGWMSAKEHHTSMQSLIGSLLPSHLCGRIGRTLLLLDVAAKRTDTLGRLRVSISIARILWLQSDRSCRCDLICVQRGRIELTMALVAFVTCVCRIRHHGMVQTSLRQSITRAQSR